MHLLGEGVGVGRPVHRGVVHAVGDLVRVRVRVRVRVEVGVRVGVGVQVRLPTRGASGASSCGITAPRIPASEAAPA